MYQFLRKLSIFPMLKSNDELLINFVEIVKLFNENDLFYFVLFHNIKIHFWFSDFCPTSENVPGSSFILFHKVFAVSH